MNAKPWYREPWPWILMSGPAAVVVASAVSLALAITSFDGLVADDYYKQGLSINRVLARESQAKALGITAALAFSPERTRVRVTMGEGDRPALLRLFLLHPTLPAEDQAITLAAIAPGVYEGAIRRPHPGKLRVRLEDADGRWRLGGPWKTRDASLALAP